MHLVMSVGCTGVRELLMVTGQLLHPAAFVMILLEWCRNTFDGNKELYDFFAIQHRQGKDDVKG